MVHDIADEAWQRLLEIDRGLRRDPSDTAGEPSKKLMEIPPDVWSEMCEGHITAINDVRAQPDLMNRLRSAIGETRDPADLALLYEVLRKAVIDHQDNPEGFHSDARVLWDSASMAVQLSLYIAEGENVDESYVEEELDLKYEWRDLNRIGGRPTTISGVHAPADSVFLLQIDCLPLNRAGLHDGVVRLLREQPLPRDGVLQLFMTGRGDPQQQSHDAGGAAVLRHLSEADLKHRVAPAGDNPLPASAGQLMVFPSFSTVVSASKAVINVVNELQDEADELARSMNLEESFSAQFGLNPFAARVAAVSRLFAFPSPGFELTAVEAARLAALLPLRGADDSYMLFIEVTASHTFGALLGDSGRLQVWIRWSDAQAHRYEQVVSFIKGV